MMKEKVLLFGGSGMVGSRIVDLLSNKYDISFPLRKSLDLTDKYKTESFLESKDFKYIIYSAGVTSVEYAEENREEALQLNDISVKWICDRAKKLGIKVIYLSTDAVFDGKKKDLLYKEDEKINPVNYYGYTKALGECSVLSSDSRNVVLRLVSVFAPFHNRKIDFARRTVNSLMSGIEVFGIKDQYFNPTYSDTAVEIIKRCLSDEFYGIYHVGSSDCVSNLDFIKMLTDEFNLNNGLIKGIDFNVFFKNSSTNRGKYSCLDVSRSISHFGNEAILSSRENIKIFRKNFRAND